MEKNKYIHPEISICNVEPNQMIADSGEGKLSISDDPAGEDFEVLSDMDKFTDIWGNEY